MKAPKLASIAIMTIQKMLANNLVAEEDMQPVVRALEQVLSSSPASSCRQSVSQSICAPPPSCAWQAKYDMSRHVCFACWAQVEELRDEGVQLKTLQTALTLMQSPLLAEDEVGLLFP